MRVRTIRGWGFVLLATVIGGLALTACGGSDPTATPTKAPVATATATATAAPAAPADDGAAQAAPTPTSAPAAIATPTTAPPVNTALDDLIAAAKLEGGELNLLTSAFPVSALHREMEDGIKARYGVDMKIHWTDGPSYPRMLVKIEEERKAGVLSSTDAWTNTVSSLVDAVAQGTLQIFPWRELDPTIAEGAVTFNGESLSFGSQFNGVVINTNFVSGDDVPKKLDDLLAPKFKDKIASTPYAAGWNTMAALTVEEEWMTDYLRKFSTGGNLAGLIRCGEEDRIISGEFWMLALACRGSGVREKAALGAPLDYVIMEDGPVVDFVGESVPKNSAHPNLAALFTLFLSTPRGQQLHYKYEFLDSHYRSGTVASGIYNEMVAKGITPAPTSGGDPKVMARIGTLYKAILRGDG